jgi:hypothetical protein
MRSRLVSPPWHTSLKPVGALPATGILPDVLVDSLYRDPRTVDKVVRRQRAPEIRGPLHRHDPFRTYPPTHMPGAIYADQEGPGTLRHTV